MGWFYTRGGRELGWAASTFLFCGHPYIVRMGYKSKCPPENRFTRQSYRSLYTHNTLVYVYIYVYVVVSVCVRAPKILFFYSEIRIKKKNNNKKKTPRSRCTHDIITRRDMLVTSARFRVCVSFETLLSSTRIGIYQISGIHLVRCASNIRLYTYIPTQAVLTRSRVFFFITLCVFFF